MTSASDSALPAGPPASSFGGWRYVHADERWEFSAEVLELADIGTVDVPDLQPLLDRMPDPEERERLAGLLDTAVREHGRMAGQFRLQTVSRGEAVFALVADTIFDDEGRAVELRGYSTDVTEVVRQATRAAVDAATRHRRAIEQVKGALMVIYRIDEVTAFALLRQRSNRHNVKLNVLSEHVSRAMCSGPRGGEVPLMELVDGVARRLSGGDDDLPPDTRQDHKIAT